MKDPILEKILPFAKMTLMTNRGAEKTKTFMKFTTTGNNKLSRGNHITTLETIGGGQPVIQVMGKKATKFSLACVVGMGDKYFQDDADKFCAICESSSLESPILLEGVPNLGVPDYSNIKNIFADNVGGVLMVVGNISKPITRDYGITIIQIECVLISYQNEIGIDYKKSFFDTIANDIDKITDIVDETFDKVEKTVSFLASFQEVFTSIRNLLMSGTQYIDLLGDVLTILANPFAGASLKPVLKAYESSFNNLIKSVSPKEVINNTSYYLQQDYAYGGKNYTLMQSKLINSFQHMNTLVFINGLMESVNTKFTSYPDLILTREKIIKFINNSINIEQKSPTDPTTINELYNILDLLNRVFDTLFAEARNGKTVRVEVDIMPQAFYFNQKKTFIGYDEFLDDNDIVGALSLSQGQEVFIR